MAWCTEEGNIKQAGQESGKGMAWQINCNKKKTGILALFTDRIELETNSIKQDGGRNVIIRGNNIQGVYASQRLSSISYQNKNKKNCKTTNKNYSKQNAITTEEFSSDINKDKAYLINEVSEVDEQAKRWVLYPCYEEETLFLEAHEAVNEVGSVLTYESPLVDPQIRRIEDIVSKYSRWSRRE